MRLFLTLVSVFMGAMERLKEDYDKAVEGWRGKGAKLHLVLTVQRPGHDKDV